MIERTAAQTGALWAFHVEQGRPRAAAETEHHACLQSDAGWAWLHFPMSDARARLFVERNETLPEAAREILLGGEHSLQLRVQSGWLFGVLPDWEREFSGESALGGETLLRPQ